MTWFVELVNRVLQLATLWKKREPYDQVKNLEKQLQQTLAEQLDALRKNDRSRFDACTARAIRLREALRRAERRNATLANP